MLLFLIQEGAVVSPAIVTGGAVAVALGLIETIKALIAKLSTNGNRPFHHGDRGLLRDLHDWHQPDTAGRQDWKNPDVRPLLTEIRDSLYRLEKKD